MYNLLNQTLKKKYQLWFDKPILTEGGETTHPKPWFLKQLCSIPFRMKSSCCWGLRAPSLLDLFPAGTTTYRGVWNQWLFFLIGVNKTWSESDMCGRRRSIWGRNSLSNRLQGKGTEGERYMESNHTWLYQFTNTSKIIQLGGVTSYRRKQESPDWVLGDLRTGFEPWIYHFLAVCFQLSKQLLTKQSQVTSVRLGPYYFKTSFLCINQSHSPFLPASLSPWCLELDQEHEGERRPRCYCPLLACP